MFMLAQFEVQFNAAKYLANINAHKLNELLAMHLSNAKDQQQVTDILNQAKKIATDQISQNEGMLSGLLEQVKAAAN
jgi:hypothetical protein